MSKRVNGTLRANLEITVRGKTYQVPMEVGIIANQLAGAGEFSGGMLVGKVRWKLAEGSALSVVSVSEELGV